MLEIMTLIAAAAVVAWLGTSALLGAVLWSVGDRIDDAMRKKRQSRPAGMLLDRTESPQDERTGKIDTSGRV